MRGERDSDAVVIGMKQPPRGDRFKAFALGWLGCIGSHGAAMRSQRDQGLRGVVASEGTVMQPSLMGKLKTCIQFLAIALAIRLSAVTGEARTAKP